MKYKILKITLLCIFLINQLSLVVAQTSSTDEQLQQKYWTYKQRYLKNFTVYSPSNFPVNGSGMPINNVNTFTKGGASSSGIIDYEDGGIGGRKGVMKVGDAPEQIGMYLSILALEYRILKNEGKSTKSVLNEIYYTIQAINRLDDKCESFLAYQSGGTNRNGFLMRDDADQQLLQFFNIEYPNTQDKNDNIRAIQSDRHNVGGDVDRSDRELNTMSKDHVMDLFKGFMFVKKFIDNDLVQPTPSDAPIHIHNEIIAITNRIMSYVTQLHPIKHQNLPNIIIKHKSYCTDSELDMNMNYVIWDPINNSLVPRGNNFNIWAYPLVLMAKSITGAPWDALPLKIKLNGTLCTSWDFSNVDTDLSLNSSSALLPAAWIAAGNQIDESLNSAQSLIDKVNDIDITINMPGLGIVQTAGLVFGSPNEIHIKPEAPGLNDFIQLNLSFATMSNTWPQSKVVAAADDRFFYNYDLMYALINNTSAIHSKSFFENILLSAPCKGNYNYNYPNNDPISGLPSWDPNWWHNNRWVHPTDANLTYHQPSVDKNEQGELNGLDYMFLYTMYRYYFANLIPEKFSNENSCPCVLQSKIESNTAAPAHEVVNQNMVISRKFNLYKNIGIYLKEYINTNLFIQNNKTVTNKTDLIICNNSIVTISNNGNLINPNTLAVNDSVKITVNSGSSILVDNTGTLDIGVNTKVVVRKGAYLKATNINSKIIVRSGGKLTIEPGALLELNNGSKLIVEDGGQVIIQANLSDPNATVNGLLTYNQGAVIQLKGDNAVLEINGRLHIGDNATFGFTYPGSNSGYIKFNRGPGVWWDNWAPNNAHITCGTNARINLQGKSKTDKMIDISQINLAIPKNLTQFVMAKCQVEFNDNIAMLETDRPTFINTSTFIRGNAINGRAGRGLLVFGQPTCIINNCDFIKLHKGITGALFYSGTKLTGVTNCYFFDCTSGLLTYGGGMNTSNNNFLNVSDPIEAVDATANSLIMNNIVNTNSQNQTNYYALGIGTHGANVEFDIQKNTVNNVDYALITSNSNIKLKCNDLQNNVVGLLAVDNAKVNMSDLLGAGYNNANNCGTFAQFIEANTFDADQGFNNFQIANGGECVVVPQSGHGPSIIPQYTVCPTIMEGSLINFIDFNPLPFNHNYQIFAEQNFWRPLVSPTDAVEDRQNKVRKIDLTDLNNPIIDSASIFTGNVLINTSLVTCPNGNGSTNCNGAPCRLAVHPLDDNSNSSIITTASFYNKKLQKALQFSLNKMDKMQNSNKVNEGADLLTECLTYNYATPVTSSVDKYLLELAYQKLFTCVAQLAEWHRDSAITFNPIPASLQTRFNDLHAICALRAGRKSISESDYKEISDLILLDKAMVYRISDNRQIALSVVNSIIASAPKATHLNMYENFRCIWSTEIEAINGSISVNDALEQIKLCTEKYSNIPKPTSTTARKVNPKQESEVVYANEYAIAVFPNPTSGNISIAYSLAEFKSITLEIFDAQGKVMGVYNLNPENKTISIDNLNLENGVYFYNIKGDGKNLMSKKLVVVKH